MSGYLRSGIRRNAKVCVTVLPSGKTVRIGSGSRLLDAVLLTGAAIVHKCGGQARCGECRVLVRSGGRGLSKIRPDEREKLDNMRGTETLSRLSCQAVLGSREITIELLTRKQRITTMSTEKIESLIHVRFAPNGTVMEIGERPQGVEAQVWFNYLSNHTSNSYQALAGGRGLFRLPRPQVDALKAAISSAG